MSVKLESKQSSEQQQRVLYAFGDSLTEGYCIESTGLRMYPFTDEMSKHMGATWKVVNFGNSGEMTESMIRRLPSILKRQAQQSVHVITILGGTNDLGELTGDEIFDNLRTLHEQAHTHGARTVAISIPEHPQEKDYDFITAIRTKVNQALKSFAESHPDQVVFFDLAAAIPQSIVPYGMWWSDGLHFSRHGYQHIGHLLFQLLKQSKWV